MPKDDQPDKTEPPGSALLDRIYELLSGIEYDLRGLEDADRREKVDIMEGFNILEAVQLLDEFGYGNRLGISAVDLAKFDAMRGRLNTGVLKRAGGRAEVLLKELEGQVRGETTPIDVTTKPRDAPVDEMVSRPSVVAVAWVGLDQKSNADLIAEISVRIDEAIRLARGSNLPLERRALSDVERAQLIALLETALHVLKAPLVEKGLLSALRSAAENGAAKAVNKGSELALGYGLGKIGELIIKLIVKTFGSQ